MTPEEEDRRLIANVRARHEAMELRNGHVPRTDEEEWPEDQRGDAWEPRPPAKEHPEAEENDPSYRLVTVDSQTFFRTDYSLEWLVKRLLVAHQPAVFGGPKKALKTSMLIDLAISLATATPFLGRFEVYKPQRVVLISGESGEAVLQECGRRICAARCIDPVQLEIFWSFRLPQAGLALDRQRLRQGLNALQASVAIIDPLYLSLLSGMNARSVEAGNLYQMGPLLSDLCRVCLEAKCTPILAHHARKGSGQNNEPLDLDDLSFAGIAEFARQWLLVNRRQPFDPNTGSSKLWLSAGGSAGQSGCWAVDVEEGLIGDDFTGRKWEVAIHTMNEEQTAKRHESEEKKRVDEEWKNRQYEDRFLVALDDLDKCGKGVSLYSVRSACGMSGDKAEFIAFRLTRAGIIERIPDLEVRVGRGAIRKVLGIRRLKNDE